VPTKLRRSSFRRALTLVVTMRYEHHGQKPSVDNLGEGPRRVLYLRSVPGESSGEHPHGDAGESVSDRKVIPRGCEFRPEVDYFQRANFLDQAA
jgi:hypothetical protein